MTSYQMEMIGMNYHFNNIMENKCIMCGTDFNGEGLLCSQECEVKINELYEPKVDEND